MTKVWKSIYRLRRTHKSYLQVTRVPSSTLFCRMKIPKKQHFFRQRQQKPIFGQLFKPKLMDQITRKNHQNTYFCVSMCLLAPRKLLNSFYMPPLIIYSIPYNLEKMAQTWPYYKTLIFHKSRRPEYVLLRAYMMAWCTKKYIRMYNKLVWAQNYNIGRFNDALRILRLQKPNCCHFRPKIRFWRFFDH